MDDFDSALIEVIKEKQPKTLEEAVRLVSSRVSVSEKLVMDRVLVLESEGKLFFEKASVDVSSSLSDYLFSDVA